MPDTVEGLLRVDEDGDGPPGGLLVEPPHDVLGQADQLVHRGFALLEASLIFIKDVFLIEIDGNPHNHNSFKNFSYYREKRDRPL